MVRLILTTLGLICVALAVVGVFVPLIPTFDFLLLASICFAKSSPRFEKWLVTHPRFGPPLRAWREDRSISRKHKIYSVAIIVLSAAVLWFIWGGSPYAKVAVLGGVTLLAWYILSRKTRLPLEACPLRPEVPCKQNEY